MLASCQLTGDHCDAHFFPSSHNVTNQALIMSPPHSLFFHKRAICDTFTSTTRNFPSLVFHLEYLRATTRKKARCLVCVHSSLMLCLGVKDVSWAYTHPSERVPSHLVEPSTGAHFYCSLSGPLEDSLIPALFPLSLLLLRCQIWCWVLWITFN